MKELLPCPFCGVRSVPPDLWKDEHGFWRVGCGGCGSHSGCNKDQNSVIKLWNNRNHDFCEGFDACLEMVFNSLNEYDDKSLFTVHKFITEFKDHLEYEAELYKTDG